MHQCITALFCTEMAADEQKNAYVALLRAFNAASAPPAAAAVVSPPSSTEHADAGAGQSLQVDNTGNAYVAAVAAAVVAGAVADCSCLVPVTVHLSLTVPRPFSGVVCGAADYRNRRGENCKFVGALCRQCYRAGKRTVEEETAAAAAAAAVAAAAAADAVPSPAHKKHRRNNSEPSTSANTEIDAAALLRRVGWVLTYSTRGSCNICNSWIRIE